jgi:hypothetical protein
MGKYHLRIAKQLGKAYKLPPYGRSSYCLKQRFILPPQYYGWQPVDEVIRQRRTGGSLKPKCYGC